jgi:hypothetical protein
MIADCRFEETSPVLRPLSVAGAALVRFLPRTTDDGQHCSIGNCQSKIGNLAERVSQTVFANYLNVTPNLVSKWERGEKRPSGPALKLLSLVEKRGLAAVA